MVHCAKLGIESEGLPRQPFNNDLGKRIYESISKEAWKGWLAHSTIIINEYRLDLMSKQGTETLLKECEKYFFGEGSVLPEQFKPQTEKHEHVHGPNCNHDHKK